MDIKNCTTFGYKEVVRFTDPATGFDAHIAIHNDKLGVGLGGCRVKKYDEPVHAYHDVMLLSKAMTYKNALAGLNYGGAKMVVNMDAKDLNEDVLKQMAECINFMGGKYYSGTDLGTTLEHMVTMRKYTPWVEEGIFGDTAVNTSLGLYCCIESLCEHLNKIPSVWVEGCGKVGLGLIKLLRDKEYNVWVTDIDPHKVQEACDTYGTTPLTEGLLSSVTVYAPCAVGDRVNHSNIGKVGFPIICGGANNQLESDDLAQKLLLRNVLYCPDYLVNAGGVITMAAECDKWSEFELTRHVKQRADLLVGMCVMTRQLNIDMLTIANFLAEKRFK